MMTIRVKTADGTIWKLDDSFTQELVKGYQAQSAIDNLHDWLLEEFYDLDLGDWLYENAKIEEISTTASMVFDLGEICEEDIEEPYANGWERADFMVPEDE